MRIRKWIRSTFPVWLALLVACGESPTAPVPVEEAPPPSDLLGLPLGGLLGGGGSGDSEGEAVEVLKRKVPLASDEVASRRIGILGGTLRLPDAGLTVVVPPLALWRRTRITVRAPAGDLVGYEFSPHGQRFRLPVVFLQDLTRTEADGGLLGLNLKGVYFEGPLEPVVNALEVIRLDVLNLLAVFSIDHFSGYAIATN